MARGIRLQRFEPENTNHWHLRAYRLRVEAVEACGGIDVNVFVYRRHPADPHTGQIFDEFVAVAGPVDMADRPIGAPAEGSDPFFRLSYVELDVRSSEEFQQIWEDLKTEVCVLVEAMDRLDQLKLAEEVWCGDSCATAVSESSATSSGSEASASA